MIQELLAEKQIPINGHLDGSPSPSLAAAPPPPPPPHSENQNLRCPRCDSSNTKFCYYNNYNLTQPRHFCKTCRRYWTKGGALRNVPIGGGCRRNRSLSTAAAAGGKFGTAAGTARMLSPYSEKAGLTDPSNPILWAPPPQGSHLLALLRATPNPNPNPTSSSTSIPCLAQSGAILSSSTAATVAAEPRRTAVFDPFSWRGNQQDQVLQQLQQQYNGFALADAQNFGGQELYQRLRSSPIYCSTDQHTYVSMSNNATPIVASSNGAVLESAPAASSCESGYWNPVWSNMPSSTKGAYP